MKWKVFSIIACEKCTLDWIDEVLQNHVMLAVNFEQCVISWTMQNAIERFFVMQTKWSQQLIPQNLRYNANITVPSE